MTSQQILDVIGAAIAYLLQWLQGADPQAVAALIAVLTDVQTIIAELLATMAQQQQLTNTAQPTPVQPAAPVQGPMQVAESAIRRIVRGAGDSAPTPKGTIVKHG